MILIKMNSNKLYGHIKGEDVLQLKLICSKYFIVQDFCRFPPTNEEMLGF